MRIVCRSLDITDEEVARIIKYCYNDLPSLILRLSKHGAVDFNCIKNLLAYIEANTIDAYSEITEFLKGSEFLNDQKF